MMKGKGEKDLNQLKYYSASGSGYKHLGTKDNDNQNVPAEVYEEIA